MATIRKRGTKWQVQVRREGSPSVSKSFSIKDDAVRWARHQELALDRGEFQPKRSVPDTTLVLLLERYETTITPNKRSKVSERAHILQIKRHIISEKLIMSITGRDVAKFRDDRLKFVSNATVRKELNILGHVFKIASQEWGYEIRDSPCKSVRKPPNGRPRDRRLREGELESLHSQLTCCRNPLVRAVFQFALVTGMRRGEVLGLCWQDIDWKDCTARLDLTKNGESRIVPLSPEALAILNELRQSESEIQRPIEDRIFLISANGFRLAWERAKKRAGITDLHFHDIRHEAVSRFFEMGLSVPEVGLISGHKDTRMLLRYTHLKPANVAIKLSTIGSPIK